MLQIPHLYKYFFLNFFLFKCVVFVGITVLLPGWLFKLIMKCTNVIV